MRVHVIQVGRVSVSEEFFNATRTLQAFRGAFGNRGGSFPVFSFVVEHPDGHIVIDTGWHHGIQKLPVVRALMRLVKAPALTSTEEEVGPRMRAVGLRPEDVRLVLPTHMDADHAGGIGHFPNSTILVNRPEWEYVTETRYGRARAQSRFWPEWFRPSLYDLEGEPYGAFAQSLAITDSKDVRVVPTPGHSPGHVSILIDDDGAKLFFAGDHIIRQDWITAEGIKLSAALHVYKKQARATNRRLWDFVREFPTIVLPSHDSYAEANLRAGEPLKV